MTKKSPLFSIIVVSLNSEKTIKDTVDSILCQSINDYEIIVKDACSCDNTLKMIPQDSRIRIYSCPDKGIYDGMNQAVLLANGQYLCFMNCGDSFYDNRVLEQVSGIFSMNGEEKLEIVYGDCYTKSKNCFERHPRVINKAFLFRHPICHQTMFFSRGVFSKIAMYDDSLRIAADYDLTWKAYTKGVLFKHCGIPVCVYDGDGYSDKKENLKNRQSEAQRVRCRYMKAQERFYYAMRYQLTLPRLRILITSKKMPAWIRNGYQKVANMVNR